MTDSDDTGAISRIAPKTPAAPVMSAGASQRLDAASVSLPSPVADAVDENAALFCRKYKCMHQGRMHQGRMQPGATPSRRDRAWPGPASP